jgi:hypothetical protein
MSSSPKWLLCSNSGSCPYATLAASTVFALSSQILDTVLAVHPFRLGQDGQQRLFDPTHSTLASSPFGQQQGHESCACAIEIHASPSRYLHTNLICFLVPSSHHLVQLILRRQEIVGAENTAATSLASSRGMRLFGARQSSRSRLLNAEKLHMVGRQVQSSQGS